MKEIKRIGIVIKPHAPEVEKTIQDLIGYCGQKNIECLLEDVAAEKIEGKKGLKREDIPAHCDLVIVLGGDGTLLTIAHLAAQENVPVMGVNLGSLGFLTEVPLDETFLALDAFLRGDTNVISQRRMLEVSYKGKPSYCLNDVVINKGALARMIQATVWIDDKQIVTTRADGLIIATPTGSTAYSLSAGGPIIQPNIPAIVLAPICPHTLSFRPMVINSESTIKVQINSREEVFLTLDGQRGDVMEMNDTVKVRASSLELHLVSSPERNYFDLLQEKLKWG
jgi:NAD+ kinase